MSGSIGAIRSQVINAADVVAEATHRADVAVTNATGLVETVRHIDQVAAMITAIASQSNLLALGESSFLRRLATALRQPLRFFLPPLK